MTRTDSEATPRPRAWRRSLGLSYRQRDVLSGYVFVAPQTIGFIIFLLIPIIAIGWFSLHDWNLVVGQFEYIGLGNFERILSDPQIGTVALNTVLFALVYIPLNVGLGLALAVAANRAFRAVGLLRMLYFAPVVVSLAAWALIFRFILQDRGLLNAALEVVGIDGPNWLRDADTALPMVILVNVLKTAGLSMVIFLAALQGIPRVLSEAAKVDGATDWAVFRRITLPLISPFVFLMVILSFIISIKSFALIQLLTLGGPGHATTVLSYYIYEQGFEFFEMGYASSLAVVLFWVVLGLTAGQFVFRKRWVYSEE